jgi:hypothetical protein
MKMIVKIIKFKIKNTNIKKVQMILMKIKMCIKSNKDYRMCKNYKIIFTKKLIKFMIKMKSKKIKQKYS